MFVWKYEVIALIIVHNINILLILLCVYTNGFKRYLYDRISWENRMIGIIGSRGIGKTIMILPYIKQNLNSKTALYVSADDL